MRQRQLATTPGLGRPRKRFVPQLTRRHLDRDSFGAGQLPHIVLLGEERTSHALCHAPDESLIRSAGPPSQTVVHMHHAQLPTTSLREFTQQLQQDHRVQSPRHAHQQFLPGLDEFLAGEQVRDLFPQIGHEAIVRRGAFCTSVCL